jgi:tetratricopeptide (TPR) repeat protein
VGEAIAEWNLGNSYKDLSAIRDLDAAEAAYKRSLGLLDPNDALGRTKCIRQMGLVHLERFWEALKGKKPPEVYLTHARAAEECCYEALKLCPKDALNDLSPIHNTLGSLYLGVGELKNALEHFERRAQLEERIGNRYGAGATRFNMALVYCRAADEADKPSQQRAHWERARAYAEAALRDYESYGGHAAKDELDAEQVLDRINRSISELTS